MTLYWRVSTLLFAFWFVCAVLGLAGLVTTLQLGTLRMQGDTSWPGLIRLQGVPWLAAALLTPAAVAWSFTVARRGRSWPAMLAAHLLGLIVFAAADTMLTVYLHQLLQARHPGQVTLEALTGRLASSAVLITTKYACLVGVASAFLHLERAAESRRHVEHLARTSAELERDLASVRLMVLRQQLQPHFLFNALNAISGLIEADPARAQRLLVQVSDLLRLALRRSTTVHATLGEELDFADRYLAVERERLGERLDVRFEIDQALLGATLPSFTVQPLVENAVRHGIARLIEGGVVAIAAAQRGGAMEIRVSNDVTADATPGPEGHGLGSLRARLSGMYGDAAGLQARADPRRFTAVLTIPLAQV